MEKLNSYMNQIIWERDTAIETLKELGYELGIRPDVIKREIRSQAIDECLDLIKTKTNAVYWMEKLKDADNER